MQHCTGLRATYPAPAIYAQYGISTLPCHSPQGRTKGIAPDELSGSNVVGCDDGHPAQYDGALDLYFLSLRNISKKWPMSIQHWQTEPNRFPIMFDEYIPQY